MTLLSQKLLSFDAGNDTKIGAKLISIAHESLTRRKVETNVFFITKDISMIGTQPIHANANIKALYGNWHKVDGKGMMVQGKGAAYEYIISVLFLVVIYLDGKRFG